FFFNKAEDGIRYRNVTGVQTCALPISLDFRLFEVFLNTFSEFTLDYLRQLRNVADAYGAEIKSVHPFTSGYEGFLLFSEYERRFEDSLEFYKQYFDAANCLGASIVVLHGQRDYANAG